MKQAYTCFFVMILVIMFVGMTDSSICQAQDDLGENPNFNIEAQTIDAMATEYVEPEEENSEGGREYLPYSTEPRLNIPASAFTSDGNDSDSTLYSFYGGYVVGTSSGFGCLKAPVILPVGAQIRYFYITYRNDSDSDIYVALRKSHFETGDCIAICSTTAVKDVGAILTQSSSVPVDEIVSRDYCYTLTTCLGNANMRLYSVRIYYWLPDKTYLHQLILQ